VVARYTDGHFLSCVVLGLAAYGGVRISSRFLIRVWREGLHGWFTRSFAFSFPLDWSCFVACGCEFIELGGIYPFSFVMSLFRLSFWCIAF
jgi:hypothetical protein